MGARDRSRGRPAPAYAPYADLVHRPGGLTALADQQIAGGIIWVLGSAAYTVTLLVGLYRWMEADSKVAQRGSAVTP